MASGILALATLLPGSLAHAADTASSRLKVSGAFRLRQESLWDQFRPGLPKHDDQLVSRAQVKAEWSLSGSWQLVGEIMDSRAFENADDGVLSANEVNVLEPIQAHLAHQIREPFGKGSSANVQLGRFTANIASRRLIASDDYRNTPNSYTGARVDVKLANKTTANIFYVLPVQRLPTDTPSLKDQDFKLDREGRELQLWGFVVTKPALLPKGALGELTYVGFREKDRPGVATRDRQLHTLGGRMMLDPKSRQWDYEVEGFWQTGHASASTSATAAELDVDAWFLHADSGYTFAASGKPRLSAEYDVASGDGPGAKYRRFDTIYGMRRADFSPSGIYSLIHRANIESLGLRLDVEPSSRLDYFVAYRLLWADNGYDSFSTSGIRDASGASGRRAGAQLDGRVRWWLVPQHWRAEFNATWFDRGRLMRDAPNASPYGDTKYVAAAMTYSF
jgi:hypothetical protein